jgi:hypothetical protein
MTIDTSFDFRRDTPKDKDPDKLSPTLRRYHKQLWSKELPDGRRFDLNDNVRGHYLHHKSDVADFSLCSDSVIPTFTRWESMKPITRQFAEEENEHFRTIGYTIGGMMVFPGNRVDGKQTINGARGFNRKIADRMDLTLECIRRHYLGESSPLAATLGRYSPFFQLFADFKGYVDFFLLQDLVDSASGSIRFFMYFDDFTTSSVPKDAGTYREYRDRSIEFVRSRNERIAKAAAAG